MVNDGAIGRPANDGDTGVWYAVLDIDETVTVEFRRVEYDHMSLAREMVAEQLPREFIETIDLMNWATDFAIRSLVTLGEPNAASNKAG